MVTGNNRLGCNLQLLYIIEKDAVYGLFVKDFEESLVDLSIIKNNAVVNYRQLCEELEREPMSTKDLIDFLKQFYIDSPGMRFLQGLIVQGLVLDIDPNWAEESSVTLKKAMEKYASDFNEE